MRKIKFRAKRKNNKEWVYGNLVIRKCDGIFRYYIYDNFYDETEISDYSYDGEVRLKDLFIEVIPETIGQYIGVKDKNGKEIYEGGIK